MRRSASAAALAGIAVFLSPGVAGAQALKDQIVGSWRLVSIYNEENGAKHQNFGDKPVGLLMFDRSGNVITFLSKPDLPKFASANRLKGSDKEYRDIMQGIVAGFGTYTVQGDAVAIKWIASTYPNRIGTTEKRMYKVAGNELSSTNPTAASGGTSYAKYVRAK
jgi:hypothetical protein